VALKERLQKQAYIHSANQDCQAGAIAQNETGYKAYEHKPSATSIKEWDINPNSPSSSTGLKRLYKEAL